MKKYTILIIFVICSSLNVGEIHAALSLSAAPVSGGNDLRFGRVSTSIQTSKEVRIRITATDSTQYQLYQRLADRFYNEKNAPINRDVVSTYTLLGSNSSGTLYAQSLETLSSTDQLLYSSASGGESDAFTVVYAIDGTRIDETGNFFGRIQYTVRPVSGGTQDDVILNVSFETSGEFKIEVEGSTTIDSVRLNHQNDRDKEGYVQLSFKENIGQKIEIYQEIQPFPQDELFDEINDDAIQFIASGATSANLQPRSLTKLSRKRKLIYSSEEGEDTFRMNFALNQDVMDQQKSGTYEGQLHYIVVVDQREQLFNIQLEVEVEPVFAIEVDLPPGGLRFDGLLPNSQPIIREAAVRVRTNLGKPYMVLQDAASPLTNEKGTEMPDQYFTFKGELVSDQNGKIVDTDYKQVPRGETSLYISDQKGSPGQFTVSYRLRPYKAMVPGDYTTSMRYSLGEM